MCPSVDTTKSQMKTARKQVGSTSPNHAPKKRRGINPAVPGHKLMARFKLDRDMQNDPASGRTFEVVTFRSVDRFACLVVAEVGGYLVAFDGNRSRMMRVFQALRWYRRHLAENWFSQRVDSDSGWLIVLGMAEGMIKHPAKFESGKDGAR